jgi:hypothetical protein
VQQQQHAEEQRRCTSGMQALRIYLLKLAHLRSLSGALSLSLSLPGCLHRPPCIRALPACLPACLGPECAFIQLMNTDSALLSSFPHIQTLHLFCFSFLRRPPWSWSTTPLSIRPRYRCLSHASPSLTLFSWTGNGYSVRIRDDRQQRLHFSCFSTKYDINLDNLKILP